MGIIFSFLPSVSRNTMCCVDVRSRKACWEHEMTVQERYAGPYHHVAIPIKQKVVKDDTPANEIEFGATVDVYAPVDTDRMLHEAHFDQIMRAQGIEMT
jgi:hypothetical protein